MKVPATTIDAAAGYVGAEQSIDELIPGLQRAIENALQGSNPAASVELTRALEILKALEAMRLRSMSSVHFLMSWAIQHLEGNG